MKRRTVFIRRNDIESLGSYVSADAYELNWRSPAHDGSSAFYLACHFQRDKVIRFLLSIPRVDITRGNKYRRSPLMAYCSSTEVDIGILEKIAEDERTDVNCFSNGGDSVLGILASRGDAGPELRCLLSTGRVTEIPYFIAKRGDKMIYKSPNSHRLICTTPENASILETYRQSPTRAIDSWRVERGHPSMRSHIFALIVFTSDGFFRLRAEQHQRRAFRFMKLALRLPMELQHLVACLAADSTALFTPHKEMERALRQVARREEQEETKK